MINYPEEFKEKCKNVYPDWAELHKALEQGRELVGRYLDDNRYETITVDDIIAAESLDTLQARAKIIKDKNNLYQEWYILYYTEEKKK